MGLMIAAITNVLSNKHAVELFSTYLYLPPKIEICLILIQRTLQQWVTVKAMTHNSSKD